MAKNKGFKGYKKEEDRYKPATKGRGKVKYQNVIKEARVNTKSDAKEQAKFVAKLAGKKISDKAASRKADKKVNTARQIDIEEKERKGVRTAKPTTPKVPVKRPKPRGGGLRAGVRIGGGGMNWSTK
jgi:hypothetical protein